MKLKGAKIVLSRKVEGNESSATKNDYNLAQGFI